LWRGFVASALGEMMVLMGDRGFEMERVEELVSSLEEV
jgi:hypothetical protein